MRPENAEGGGGARERRHGRLRRGTGGEEAVAHSYRASRHQTAGEADTRAMLGKRRGRRWGAREATWEASHRLLGVTLDTTLDM
jgi:hypothetical protein